jgi:large subunit ribosomal protein L9
LSQPVISGTVNPGFEPLTWNEVEVMEIILIENVDKLGSRGQLVKVAAGYGRNYLLPKKLAVAATPQNRAWVHQQRVRFLKLEAKEKGEAAELAQILDGVSLTFTRKSGEHGTLFGSVTAIDVAEGLTAQGYKIDRRKIQLSNPLKVVGEYDVPIRLHREVTSTIKLKVEAEKSPEVIAAEAEAAKAAAAAEGAKPAGDGNAPAEAKGASESA